MRKALVVGVDYYEHLSELHGCVNDAGAVARMLEEHADRTPNFAVRSVTAAGPDAAVTKGELKELARELFATDADIALFYFAGHGYVETTGGYLCGSECRWGDDGLSLHELIVLANDSRAKNRIIILDSCHSGVAGTRALAPQHAEIMEGMTILTASTKEQYATEANGSGVFTALLVDALGGAAANLVGDVTPGGVYAHIDQSLGPWDQRPVFKTNVKSFVALRRARAPIEPADLRRLPEFFPAPNFELPLDPSYEPESEQADPAKTAVLAVLQRYNRVNLVVPVGAPHMYHAAMWSKSCMLTPLGRHYRRLVVAKRI
jgi:hypothetical protein